MSKKTALPKKGKPTHGMGDPPPSKIKETLVGDPAISFTIGLNVPMSEDGYYVNDFKMKISLTNVNNSAGDYIEIARMHIKSLSTNEPYFYVPFGDPDYRAGQEFWMKLELSGRSPIDGRHLKFNDNGNVFEQHLMGGGILESSSSNGKQKKRKK
jgi:hypothetical protein